MEFDVVTCASIAAISTACIFIGDYLDKDSNIVNEILQVIFKTGKTLNIKASCELFIKSFDLIYTNNSKKRFNLFLSYFIWIFVFINLGLLLFMELFMHLSGEFSNTVQLISGNMLFGASIYIIVLFFVIDFHKSMHKFNEFFDNVKCYLNKEKRIPNELTCITVPEKKVSTEVSDKNYNGIISVLNEVFNPLPWIKKNLNMIQSILEGNYNQSSMLKGLCMSICSGLGAGIMMVGMGYLARILPPLDPQAAYFQSNMELFNLGFFGTMCLMFVFTFLMFFFCTIYAYSFLYAMEKYKLVSRFSSLAVISSTIFAISLFSGLKWDLISPVISDSLSFKFVFVPLIFFNIITDSFSILETRYMLGKAVSSGIIKLIVFLILDFLASSLIYLLVPAITGDLNLFLDAIFFKGEIAWVGVFYWSSLFTSLFLYLYIISFAGLTIFHRFSNIKYLAEKPSYTLGWIFAFLIIILYLLYIGLEIIISNIIPILMILSLVFFMNKIIQKART